MIHDVDEALRKLVLEYAVNGSGAEVSFEAPTKDWAARRNTPTVNVYLYDVREDLERRQVEWEEVRDDSGRVSSRRPPPRRYKLSYLVTCWTQRPEDEHRLLSTLLATFLRYETVPREALGGTLQEIPQHTFISIALPPPKDRSLADVWSALGGELKPSLDLVVTAPFDSQREMEAGPPVLEEPRFEVLPPEFEGYGNGSERAKAGAKKPAAKGKKGKAAAEEEPTPVERAARGAPRVVRRRRRGQAGPRLLPPRHPLAVVERAADASLAHLLGRLGVVEARVRAAVNARRAGDPNPDDPFRGLYLSEDHVERLLSTDEGTAAAEAGSELLPEIERGADRAEKRGEDVRLRRLARTFSLEPVDVELLLVALAPDVDARFERLYGYLHDDVTRRRASIGLALELSGALPASPASRHRLMQGAPLLEGGLVIVEEPERPFLTRSLRVPDRVAMHLLGDDHLDAALADLAGECPACYGAEQDGLARAIPQRRDASSTCASAPRPRGARSPRPRSRCSASGRSRSTCRASPRPTRRRRRRWPRCARRASRTPD